jgi:outer membrane protein OmpA-like peptidoglycan-associated protein
MMLMMNRHARVVALGGVVLGSVGCAGAPAGVLLEAPAPIVTAAPPPAPPTALPLTVAGAAPVEAPAVMAEPCVELKSPDAREVQAPAKPPAEFAQRTASEALDRLALIVPMSDEQRGKVITLPSDEMTEPGQWTLMATARYRLDQLVPALREQEGHRIVVQGYTDSLGTAALNDTLSVRRAQAVCEYLVTRGVPVHALRFEGLGARRPVRDNATPEGRSHNRRIEIVIGR